MKKKEFADYYLFAIYLFLFIFLSDNFSEKKEIKKRRERLSL